ncbi:MAG: DMT family transporter [Acidobacteriota bacterium]
MGRDPWAPLALLTYALAFSLAYLRLDAGLGALLLFGTVQLVMIGVGMAGGERPTSGELLGVALAIGGLGILTVPGASAPSPVGAALMVLAGVGWAVYSLRGRRADEPIAANARSFVLTAPVAVLVAGLAIAMGEEGAGSTRGIGLAVLSGAVASGLGYAFWYAALAGLTATRAAIVQLVVPVLAALGSVIFLAETVTSRLLLGGAAVLLGIALALLMRRR